MAAKGTCDGGKLAGLALLLSACAFDGNVSVDPASTAGDAGSTDNPSGADAAFDGDGAVVVDNDAADLLPPACLLDPTYELRPSFDHRYRHEANGLFYDQAQASCAATGAYLVVIDDSDENDYVTSLGGAPWIGFNDYAVENGFEWVTGAAISFTKWSGGEPSDSGGDEDCVLTQGGNWNDGECSNLREFVCECDPAVRIPLAPACMNSAAYSQIFQGRRYRSENNGATYVEAIASCAAEGGHLAVVTDAAENDYVRAMISDTAWIGFSDSASEGSFTWITGSASSYNKWTGPQPDDSGGEDCVEVNTNGDWNDQKCTATRDFVCECDPTVAINSLSGI